MRFFAGLERFSAGSITHAAVLGALVGGCALLAQVGRQARALGGSAGDDTDRRVGVGVLLVWLAVFLRDLRPDRLSWIHSLPLHVCDVAGLAGGLAILTGNRTARSILHFWGLALSSQAFAWPVLRAGPIHSDFWLYWMQHGAIVAVAVYDLAARGYRPQWRDWRRATVALGVYALLVLPVNALLGGNYGYLGQTEHAQRSVVSAFGDWPDRVPALYLCACAVMAAMVLPWHLVGTTVGALRPRGRAEVRMKMPIGSLGASRAA